MDATDSKKAKISEENKRESEALAAIWDRTQIARDAKGLGSQEAFGAEYGIGNQAAVGHFLRGRSAISLKAAEAFARGLGCSVEDFSPRLAAEIRKLAAALRPGGAEREAPAGHQRGEPWPFEGIDRERWDALTERQKGAVESATLEAIEAIEARAGNRHAA